MLLLFFVVCVVLSGYLFYTWYPPFGGHAPKSTFSNSANRYRQKFRNLNPSTSTGSGRDIIRFLRRRLQKQPGRVPPAKIVADTADLQAFVASRQPQLIWLGHSTFLTRLQGQTLLFDPVFSKRASPFQSVGPRRFDTAPRLQVEDLPPIDAVIISHDHYDHLDYGSIRKLRAKTGHFFVPLGLGAHLQKWGIAAANITELDWWQEKTYHTLTFACTPARHFSGRTLTDRDATLWASWAISSATYKLFFSGDGGYGPHFRQIGDTYGPFDVTLLECGQYDTLWADIHMTPEQTAQAHVDLGGKLLVPMHWGAFMLALHDWTEPIERLLVAAQKARSRVVIPRIGEAINLSDTKNLPVQTSWWK